MKRTLAAAAVLLATLVTVGVTAGSASASFTTVQAAADTYSNPGAPASNFGHSYSLAVGGSVKYTSFLRFTLPADAATATLNLSVNTQTFAGSTSTFKVNQAGDGWGETTLTKNNQPALGVQLATFKGAVKAGSVSVPLGDVSSLAGQTVTFAVSANVGTDDLWLWSRDNPTLGKRPSLAVTVAGSGGGGGSGPVVGVLGDSISQGCCSESTGTVARPYWMVAANELGWGAPVVDAVGGSGYQTAGSGQPYTVRVGPFLDAHPGLQALIVQGGNNDTAGLSTLPGAVESVFDTIAAHGVPHVYVLGPYSPDGGGQYAQQRADIKASAVAHGFVFIDQVAEGWMIGRADGLYHDGFHPNETGHELLGERLAGDLAVLACNGCLP